MLSANLGGLISVSRLTQKAAASLLATMGMAQLRKDAATAASVFT
jgi:hypothetical protein